MSNEADFITNVARSHILYCVQKEWKVLRKKIEGNQGYVTCVNLRKDEK